MPRFFLKPKRPIEHWQAPCTGACGARNLLRFAGAGDHVSSVWHAARIRVQ